ncbi:MAG: TetR/AcrR family transcriptional regulator [Deltaproteobacteria bacterium]|nr:TetR/AcrR family transcriptional regulator [Deltaproteobacteria bacterium]
MVDSRTEKRKQLVQVAQRVIQKQGIRKTTLEDIARAAGMATTSVYYYFKNKNKLLRAVVSALIDSTLANVEAAIFACAGPEEKLIASWKVIFMAITDSAILLDLGANSKPEVVALAGDLIRDFEARYKKLIRNIIVEGVERDLFHVEDIELTVTLLSSGTIGLITTIAGEVEYELIGQHIDELGELLMNGLRQR